MVGDNRDGRAEQEGVWTIVAHNSCAGGRVCRKGDRPRVSVFWGIGVDN